MPPTQEAETGGPQVLDPYMQFIKILSQNKILKGLVVELGMVMHAC